MLVHAAASGRLILAAGLISCMLANGCGTAPDAAAVQDENANVLPIGPVTRVPVSGTLFEPPLDADSDNSAPEEETLLSLEERIDEPGQVIEYSIGQVVPGDKITVEVTPLTRSVDPAMAVLDNEFNALAVNDDALWVNDQFSSFASFIAREHSPACTVIVTSSPRADTTGPFYLHVTRQSAMRLPDPEPQVVYLNFEGAASVVIGSRSPVNVPHFAGQLIGPEFAGDTEELIERAVSRVRRDYAGYNVILVSSRESPRPTGDYSTVHMGSYDAALLGVADNIDVNNQWKQQQAIVFVDTFAAFLPLDPSVEEIVDALANVTSHEIGHLLGLNHTADSRGIMDTTANLGQMLRPQTFLRSPINPGTFVVGYQDAPRILMDTVGGSPVVVKASKLLARTPAYDPWYDSGPAIPARSFCQFGTGCSSQN